MKKILYILFVLLSFNAFSQSNSEFQKTKKTHVWYNNNSFLTDYINKFTLLDSGHTYFYVPIVLHIYLNPNENSERLFMDIKFLIQRLNAMYADNKTGIQFYISSVEFLKNNRHLKTGYVFEAPMISRSQKYKYALNVYYVNVLQKKFFNYLQLYHGVYNSVTNSVIIIRHSSKSTLSHEIGHFFGLEHPHKNWKKGKNRQECVSRTRTKGIFRKKIICEVNGDALSDTPAEPNLSKMTGSNCLYISELTDAWGEKYQPNTNNIMSYPGDRACRKIFTPMQKAVMLYTANSKKQAKYWKNTPENKHFRFDAYEPDDKKITASLLEINKKQYHTFHKTIISNNYKLAVNNLDFLYILKNNSDSLCLSFDKEKYNFPEMKISVIDNGSDTLQTNIINNECRIPLNISTGKFYICLELLSSFNNNELFDYSVELLNLN